MTSNIGPQTEQPTLISALFDLIDASIQQGRAIERVDHSAAAHAYRDQLAALSWILKEVGQDVSPASLLTMPPGRSAA